MRFTSTIYRYSRNSAAVGSWPESILYGEVILDVSVRKEGFDIRELRGGMMRLRGMMTLTLHTDRPGRRVAGLPAVLALTALIGRRGELPINPVLERAYLDVVEERLGSPAPGRGNRIEIWVPVPRSWWFSPGAGS